MPSKSLAFTSALELLSVLEPDFTNDPETLGLAGAIHKRLWQLNDDFAHLEKSIEYYKRGFEVRKDYYNGENLAFNYDFMASKYAKARDSKAYYFEESARQVRIAILDRLNKEVEEKDFSERSDRHWVFATLANCYFGIDDETNAHRAEASFRKLNPAEWQVSTYEKQKAMMLDLKAKKPGPTLSVL
jgi:MAP3K TRAFs-binding domain